MARALHLSPMVPSYDLNLTQDFFVDCLGFSVTYSSDAYRIVEKDGLSLHILPAGDDIGQMEFYLEVDQLDELWSSVKDKVASFKHKPPFDQPYGMREAHIEVPATRALLFLGQVVPA